MPISGEAAFSVTKKDSNGDLCTIRGGSYDEFVNNISEAVGEHTPAVLELFAGAFGGGVPTPAQAHGNVIQAFPGAQPVQQQTVPVPVPQAAPFQQQAAPVNAPSCPHGQMIFKNTRTKNNTMWARFECPQGWQSGCKSVNA